ncbi:Ent-kaurene oxidase [Rhypophila decipiens]|uniref:Ent-kaurene oxidase n=1 Tax=Rhypophila decipiens TaxID=261697 RepID=A0AAN6YEK9_9PEZI|nr:Ent-kaurene oxidase [Rhypophila decipiens]
MTAILTVLASSSAVVWLLSIIWRRLVSVSKVNVPHIAFEGDNSAVRYIAEGGNLLVQGYEKYNRNGQAFAIRNSSDPKRPIIILPMRYLEEVKNAPQSQLSFPLFMEKVSLQVLLKSLYSTRRSRTHILHRNLIHPIQNIIAEAISQEMPQADNNNWNSLGLPQPFLAQVFARVAAHVLVGPELAKGRWPSLSRDYVNSVTKAPGVVRHKYHPYFRWVAKYLEPSVKTVLKYRREAAELLKPTLVARTAEPQQEETRTTHQDAIQWLIETFQSRGKTLTPDTLAQSIFGIMTAAIDSTSATATWMLYDLLQHPDAFSDIREEIQAVQKRHIDDDPGSSKQSESFIWTRQTLSELRVLDSFLRESLRLHSFTLITLERMAVKPYTFKDGLHIPKHTQVAFARVPHSLDPDVHSPDPTKFDHKRHLRKRVGDDATRFHFTSVSEETLAWGAGMHACPGRFLAGETLKLIFVSLVMGYEMKFDKAPGPDRMMGMFIAPDNTATVLVKKI